MNGVNQVLFYADNFDLLGGNINTVKKNTSSVRRQWGCWSRSRRRES